MGDYDFDYLLMDDPQPHIITFHLKPQTKMKDNIIRKYENTQYQIKMNSTKLDTEENLRQEFQDHDQIQEKILQQQKQSRSFECFDQMISKQNQIKRVYLSPLNPYKNVFSVGSPDSSLQYSKRGREKYLLETLTPTMKKFSIIQTNLRNSIKILQKNFQSFVNEKAIISKKKEQQRPEILSPSISVQKYQPILKSPDLKKLKKPSQKVRFKLPSLVNCSKKILMQND